MNAFLLKREIETLLGLSGPQAHSFWQSLMCPPPPPTGPVPIPYPNIAMSGPSQAAGAWFAGRDFVNQAVQVVQSAASGDAPAAKAWPLWLHIKRELATRPAERAQLLHELVHAMRERTHS
jgi:hypothetical protein